MPDPPDALEALRRENDFLREQLERLRAGEDPTEGQGLLQLFVKHSPIYAFIKHVTPEVSRVLVASENYADMIGVPGSQMAGKTMHDLFPAEFADKISLDDWEVASGGGILHLDEDLNGRHYTTIKFPITVGEKRLLAGYTIDITDRRRAEEERRDLQASLAQSDRLASMGMLAAGVAHEINNPLAYLLVNAESLVEDLPTLLPELTGAGAQDFSNRLQEIISGAHRIQRIARDLNTFSRQDGLELVPVRLQDSIEHALNMVSNELKYRARVIRDFQPVPRVMATEGKLAQVFLNLLINSAQAINVGKGTGKEHEIRVRVWTENDQVCAEVSDTGSGIPEDVQPRIFEPFFTTKGIGFGTGLGLSICRNIVSGFSGEIGFSSCAGQCTRFWIRLPAMHGEPLSVPTPPRLHSVEPHVRGRVLVIDDEPGIRSAITRILVRRHEITAVGSAEEAMALIMGGHGFDIIICDLMMSKMTGVEFHAWLVDQDPDLARRVIFITGGVFTQGTAEYLSLVGNLRIEKPFNTEEFRKIVDEHVLSARDGSES
ncbi:MAG: hypothetical protein CVU65_08940 [Deltaproteobacteria bacterium HGW-Deltaproteobacteria-22]|nr:MAG: hypothetical protein CVU65_08940 [Deltaproteobacteria bacterium HGW-Deltaproteobacteria-22]